MRIDFLSFLRVSCRFTTLALIERDLRLSFDGLTVLQSCKLCIEPFANKTWGVGVYALAAIDGHLIAMAFLEEHALLKTSAIVLDAHEGWQGVHRSYYRSSVFCHVWRPKYLWKYSREDGLMDRSLTMIGLDEIL